MSLNIKEDSVVYRLDQQYVIKKILDYHHLLAKNVDNGEICQLHINELSSKPIQEEKIKIEDLSLIPKKKIEEATNRLEAIKPILNLNSRKMVEKRAKEIGVSPTTLYNWMRAYESTGQLSSLASLAVKGGKGKSRLLKEQEDIIDLVFKEYYLTKIRPTIQRVWEEIAIRCKRAEVSIPSIASVRRRARKISEKEQLKKRHGKKSIEQFEIIKDKYPDGLYPMHVLQIDHTKADVILVDDTYRTELGRPWITMAIDIYSRMVAGFYISFEAPGFFATGQTISNSILPKDILKEKFKFKSSWPICGIPKIIHMDNAAEFRGTDLQNVAQEYGIDILWRPVGKARFGGHIERLLGSLTQYIHTLEGTTFEKVNKNREYDAQKEAVMTLEEFDKWLTLLITDVYHKKIHTELNKTPLQKFDEGVFGTESQPPKGFAPRIENIDEFKINLLPKEERTVQRWGIQVDNIYYYSEVLNNYIDAVEEHRGKKYKKKFIIRRDYRDISFIWFYNPIVRTYYKIPYRNTSLPKVSIWEYKAAKNHLKSIENIEYNENEVFDALEKLKNIAKESKNKTKLHRKIIDRETKHKKHTKKIELISKIGEHSTEESKINNGKNHNSNEFDWFEEDITPFEGIEENIINKKDQDENISTNSINIDNENNPF